MCAKKELYLDTFWSLFLTLDNIKTLRTDNFNYVVVVNLCVIFGPVLAYSLYCFRQILSRPCALIISYFPFLRSDHIHIFYYFSIFKQFPAYFSYMTFSSPCHLLDPPLNQIPPPTYPTFTYTQPQRSTPTHLQNYL